MTVASTTNRKQYTGDASTTNFATSPVVFFDTDDLTVYVVTTATGASTTLTENTHYTVSGGSGSTGTVNLAGGSSPYGAPAATQTLVIVRELDLVQEADFVNNDSSDAEVAEDSLDKLTMMVQQLDAALDRAFKLSDSDVSGASTALPVPAASKLIGWDSAGTALANYAAGSIAGTVIPTAFMETLLDDTAAAIARTTLDAQQDVFTTRGDLVRGGVAGAAERVALGASGTVLTSDGTDAAWAAPAQVLPRSYLAGCALSNNGTDATNDIDIAAGQCRNTGDTRSIAVAAMTKRLDANWVAGTNQGMRNSAAAIANGTYHIYAVAKADGTQDIYAYAGVAGTNPDSSASVATVVAALQAESGGTDYLYARRIGSILRVAGAIVAFQQAGDEFLRNDAGVLDVDVTNQGSTAVDRSLSVPLGLKPVALLNAYVTDASAGSDSVTYIKDKDISDQAASVSAAPLGMIACGSAGGTGMASLRVRTDRSGRVTSRAIDASAVTLRIATMGWIDSRGRDD